MSLVHLSSFSLTTSVGSALWTIGSVSTLVKSWSAERKGHGGEEGLSTCAQGYLVNYVFLLSPDCSPSNGSGLLRWLHRSFHFGGEGRHRKVLSNYPRFSEQVATVSFWFKDKKDFMEEEK